ncbi:MAG TPA: hypothetical protein ENK02_04875 [Planctomycetes bacterium]|nr:hypothetical protein [Planctomycetota bacterium]
MRFCCLAPSLGPTIDALGLSQDCLGAASGTVLGLAPGDRTEIGTPEALDIPAILALQPDLCLADPLWNKAQDLESLSASCKVLELPAPSLAASKEALRRLGETLDVVEQAQALILAIEAQELAIEAEIATLPPLRVALLLSKDPWLAAGSTSYEHSLLTACGATNIYEDRAEASLPVDEEDLRTREPEGLLLSCPPFHAVDLELLEGDLFLAPRPILLIPMRDLRDRLAHSATALQDSHNLLMALRKNIGKA